MSFRGRAVAAVAISMTAALTWASGTGVPPALASQPDINSGLHPATTEAPPTDVTALLPAQKSSILPDTRWRHVKPEDFVESPIASKPIAAEPEAPAPIYGPPYLGQPASVDPDQVVAAADPAQAGAAADPSSAAAAASAALAAALSPDQGASDGIPIPPGLPPGQASASSATEPAASPAEFSTPPWTSSPPPWVLPGDFDIPMPWGEKSFEAYRRSYLSEGGRKWLEAMVERGRPWMSFIMEKLYAYGLPEELAWLPIIESEFTPNAVSRSGAVGMWQFMRNSISGYGIRVDDWVDERRDFMKATDAALRKLSDNYEALGDWNLAVAAYNMGLGAISRAVAAGKTRDFFALRRAGLLSSETSAYVPKFLAIASILRYPARNGLRLSWNPPVEWETVEPKRSVDLGLLASASGVSVERLRAANAELRYTVTPPWKGYLIKVPEGTAAPIVAALQDSSKKLLRYALHVVRSGDSVSALSRAYGAPVQLIVDANPGLQPSRIRIGQVLVIPVIKDGAQPPPPVPMDDTTPFGGSYVVQKGDSLWSLALRYGVRPETLAARNGLELTSVLREGMSLSVPITKP